MFSLFLTSLLTLSGAGALPDEREAVARLQGTWHVTLAEENGDRVPKARRENAKLTITGFRFKLEDGKTSLEGSFSLGSDKKPKAFDAFAEVGPSETAAAVGIYKLEGETLTVCFSKAKKRPAEFKTEPGDSTVVIVAQRQAGEKAPH